MLRITVALTMALCIGAGATMAADDDEEWRADFWLGPSLTFDFENDSNSIGMSFSGSGSGVIAPDFGLYSNKLLLGVRYCFLGTRSQPRRGIYGGPTVFWYDEHIGGGLIVGTRLDQRVVLEASYRATGGWNGQADLSLRYGFKWPW